jgi:mannosyltransferase
MKRKYLVLLLISLIGLVLRVIALNTRGIFYDDAFSFFLSRQPLGAIISGTAADTMPPLYYFLLHFWITFGHQLWVLRLLSVLLSLLTIIMAYFAINELFGCEPALLTSFLLAISPFQIYHAQELRMYSLLLLMLIIYNWMFFKVMNSQAGTKEYFISSMVMVLAGCGALYSHNLAIFSMMAPLIYLLIKRKWRLFAWVLPCHIVMMVLFIPWLLYVPEQIEKIQRAFWTPRPGIVEILQALIQTHAGLPIPDNWLPLLLGSSLLILAIVCMNIWFQRKKYRSLLLILLIIGFPPVLLFVLSYLMRPVFVPRGMILSMLGYYGLVGLVNSWQKIKILKVLLPCLFVINTAIVLPYQYQYNTFPRSPYKEAMDGIRLQLAPGDVVLHDNKLSYFPSHYFAEDLDQVFLADEPGSSNDTLAPASMQAMGIFPIVSLEEAVKGHARVFFVVYEKTIQEYLDMGYAMHPVMRALEEQYQVSSQTNYTDLLIIIYERRTGE